MIWPYSGTLLEELRKSMNPSVEVGDILAVIGAKPKSRTSQLLQISD
jgi:hypothetical protein